MSNLDRLFHRLYPGRWTTNITTYSYSSELRAGPVSLVLKSTHVELSIEYNTSKNPELINFPTDTLDCYNDYQTRVWQFHYEDPMFPKDLKRKIVELFRGV